MTQKISPPQGSAPQPANDSPIGGNVMMYNQPEPLSLEAHGHVGLVQSDTPFGFATIAHAVPLHVTEFGPASLSYPLIFAGDNYSPLAILSIRPNENLFVSPEGRFEPEAYVPAFIRRYPFVLAADDAQQRMVVCIDRKAPFIVEHGGDVKLFENGQPTEYTRNAIKFCEDFESERQRTDSFVKLLRDLDLFETKVATFTPRNEDGTTGEPIQISEYFAVDEARLAKLTGEQMLELRNTGALSQIYAHMTSLFGWERLIARTLVRAPTATA